MKKHKKHMYITTKKATRRNADAHGDDLTNRCSDDEYDEDLADRRSDTVVYGEDLTDCCLDADTYSDDLVDRRFGTDACDENLPDRHFDADTGYKNLTDHCFDADEGEYVLFPTGELAGPFDNVVASAQFYAAIGEECRIVTLGEQFDGVEEDNKGVVFSEEFISPDTDLVADDEVDEYPDGGYAVGADGIIGPRKCFPGHYDMFKELGGHRCIDGSWGL